MNLTNSGILPSNKEKVLENFFASIGQCNYDRAKEVVDREIANNKGCAPSLWTNFIPCLLQLQQSERAYIHLSFLLNKGFLKKEAPKCGYESLRGEFERLEDFRKRSRGDADNLLLHFSSRLVDFTSARILMCDLYERMCALGSSRFIAYEELLDDIKVVKKKIAMTFHHPMLAPLHSLVSLETEVLEELITALILVHQWKFFESMQHIYVTHSKLQTCYDLIQKESRKMSFGGSLFAGSPSSPPLFHWMCKFKSAVLSKFSLYFYDILIKQTNESNMKGLCAKNSVDYPGKILNFIKKTDCFCVALVLDTTGLKDFKGAGYSLPAASSLRLAGLEAYPPIVCFPSEISEQLKDPQKCRHWPSVLMLMSQRAADLNALDRVVSFFDIKAHCTYFLSRIDPLITLVGIWECRKNERDSYINQFLQETSVQLRCNKVLLQLKP